MGDYIRFNPDLWKVVFNYDAIATVITLDDESLNCAGHFRTSGDYIGIFWDSEDKKQHEYCAYPKKIDYTDCLFSFEAKFEGAVCHFDDTNIVPAVRVVTTENEYDEQGQFYVTMGFFGTKHEFTEEFVYNGEINLRFPWIDIFSTRGIAKWNEPVYDELGNIVDYSPKEKNMNLGDDYDMDFVTGRFFTTIEAGVPEYAIMTFSYTYNTHEKYIFDFNNLFEGTHPNFYKKIDQKQIYKFLIPIVPTYFTSGNLQMTGRSDCFNVNLSKIEVVSGFLGKKPQPMKKHLYRVAEGFDDEYDKNPKRIAEVMFMLGYDSIVNLYVGASHFYDKKGLEGQLSDGYTSMVLDEKKGINNAYRQWLDSYLKHLKICDVDEFVLSVSMENLQMPNEWRQLINTGVAGGTGWSPPTNFYSPTMPEVKTYIRKVSKEMLDIMVDNKFKPILQLGEPWWWFQEFQHGNVNLPYEGKPPCFYDKYTKKQFKEDTGKELKVYDRSDYFYINEIDDFYTSKLRQYLGEYSDFMKSISAEYENSEYAVLFFPPSVIDKGRTPLVMQKVNAPFEFWDDNKLDFIQIEDYDWIVHDHPEHLECYMFAWDQLGYPFHKQHYFTGFAWEEFGIPIETQWERIEKAGAGAISRGFRETFVWAGSQIRRDSWVPKANYYSSDGERWLSVNFHPHI